MNRTATSVETATRNTSYDFIRVIAMALVLAIHTLNRAEHFAFSYNTTWYLVEIFSIIFMVCNPLFFMLSGKFTLNKKFGTAKDYLVFYLKKAVTIVLPFVLLSVVGYMAAVPVKHWGLFSFARKFLSADINGVYWFMYVLISIVLFSPFFAKMLQSMSLTDKRVFFWVLVITNSVVSVLKIYETNLRFSYGLFGIITWHLFFFIGYFAEEIFPCEKQRNIIIIIGFLAFAVHLAVIRFIPKLPYSSCDPTPWTIAEALGVYFLLLRIRTNPKFNKIIGIIAGLSFIFYLIHMDVLVKVSKLFPLGVSSPQNALCAIGIYIVSFIITLAAAYVINTFIMRPLQKLILKIFRV